MRWGTSHFVSRQAAERYYRDYGYADVAEAVTRKIADGEIHIGKPALLAGQSLSIIPGEGRYQIDDAGQEPAPPSEAHPESLRMEAALCIWECMHDTQASLPDRSSMAAAVASGKVLPWQADMDSLWNGYGTVGMRHKAIALAEPALKAFDLVGGHEGAEELGLDSYDWEFIPAFVARVDWKNDGLADPADIARRLKEERTCSKTS